MPGIFAKKGRGGRGTFEIIKCRFANSEKKANPMFVVGVLPCGSLLLLISRRKTRENRALGTATNRNIAVVLKLKSNKIRLGALNLKLNAILRVFKKR